MTRSLHFILLILIGLPIGANPGAARASADLPYDTDTGTEVGILAASAALWAYGLWGEKSDPSNRPLTLEEAYALDPNELWAYDRGAIQNWSPAADKLSDHFLHAAIAAPLIMDLSDVGRKKPLALTTMHLEALLLNGGATYLIKNLVKRPRPFVYNRDPRIPDTLVTSRTARRSFPSGHTSTTFASLVFMATVYGKMSPDSESRYWVWGGCLTAATTTGYLRYRAGRHFLTDIWAGAALGSFVGWLVPQMHEMDVVAPGSKNKSRPVLLGLSIGF